ncbi:MAG: MBL fold metallo-hydrolase [Rhizobium sp.]
MNQPWSVHVIEYATSNEPWVGLVNGMEDDGMVDLPFSFVLATSGERRVLVDCGFMQSGAEGEFPLKHSVSRWISPLRMLAALEILPGDITDIVVTHAHFDHMGSIAEFRNARIHIQKDELLSWYEAIALPVRFSHLTKIIDPQNLRDALNASIEHRVSMIEGDRDNIIPGIHVRTAPGHTVGQQFVILETSGGRRLVSGDCVYTSRQITGHRHDGHYVPLNNATGSVWDQLKTIDRINDEIDGDLERLIILHDVERWKASAVVCEIDGFRIVKIA